MTNIHSVPHSTGWALYKTGAKKAFKTGYDKDAARREAITYASRHGRTAYIHDEDGRVKERILVTEYER